MKKLKPCPYCGEIAKVKTVSVKFRDHTIEKYYVECSECGAATDQFNTYFAYNVDGKKFQCLNKKEAIERAIHKWNNEGFNEQTRLSHMSYREKVIWQIEALLKIAWYGAMVPVDSMEYKTGWKLREIAENKGLLKLHSEINYDLGEVSKVLFNDVHAKDAIYEYLAAVNNMELKPKQIKKWTLYFNEFIEGKEYVEPTIKDRIVNAIKAIGRS